uniref:Solute carrier family 3 member 2b n=1 Tax=Sander lucioperca TaxID=283035 RepID=A0A8D0A8X7_SANLU
MTGGGDGAEDAVSAGGGETVEENGSVKLKMPEEAEVEEVKFTGLNKEELLRVAGTPGWVRTRWALLVAPRCRDLPDTAWWNGGPLYQIGNIQAFTDAGDLKGVEQKMGSLSQLKVRGLLLGPIHVAPPDEAMSLRFEEISSELGNLEQFRSLVQAAHKKGEEGKDPYSYRIIPILIVLVAVLNCASPCLQSALVFWMNEGVDGVQLAGVERVASVVPSLWLDIRAIVQNGTEERPDKRSENKLGPLSKISALLSSSGVDLLVSRVLRPGNTDAGELAQSVQLLYSSHSQTQLAWNLGGRAEGHLASLVGPALVRLHTLLLLTLPGAPVVNYGDEIGLMDQVRTRTHSYLIHSFTHIQILWINIHIISKRCDGEMLRLGQRFFRVLSELRGKERSLLYGDFLLLSNSSSSLAFQRVWDQSERYIAAFNWAPEEAALPLSRAAALPQRASVVLSTNASALPADSSVDLTELRLGPGQAALLRFPYTG